MRKFSILLILLAAVVGCARIDHARALKSDEYLEGYRARKLNLPANANPYTGTTEVLAYYWLEGYMDCQEEISKNSSKESN